MFVKKNSSSSGRTILTYTYGYRENGKVKHKNYEIIGYLDELEKIYDDPIAHFKAECKKRFSDFKPDEAESITIFTNREASDDDFRHKKNVGSVFLKKLLGELGLEKLINKKQMALNVEYPLFDILEFLVLSRILFPGSKKETFEKKDRFFDKYNFSLHDIYRALDHLNELKDDIQKTIWKQTEKKYQRDASTSYYDCTNYYFEISYNDNDLLDEEGNIIEKGYRKNGPSKEHRKTPIIQLGLYMDKQGIPLSYHLFPGNESEKTSLLPSLKKTQSRFGINRTIVVADRGLNTSDNIFFLAGKNTDSRNKSDGYVYGQSILGADKEFKEWVLAQEDYKYDPIFDDNNQPIMNDVPVFDEAGNITGYEQKQAIFKHKSRLYAKKIKIKRDGSRNQTYTVYQKQMVYYSAKYAERERKKREQVILKATDLIKNPYKYNKATSYGAAGYIKNLTFDKKTGEVIVKSLTLDIKKIEEEAKYDGYYSIVTSEKHLSDHEMRNIYKGLWKIEESFKITKSHIKSRPVHVWTSEHIEAHFLTCFIALILIRLLEVRLSKKYSINEILDTLRECDAQYLEQNFYISPSRSEILSDLEEVFDCHFKRKYIHRNYFKEILR